MATADPAVVNPQRNVGSAANLGGKLIENNFTRAGQRILADEAKFHGSGGGCKLQRWDRQRRAAIKRPPAGSKVGGRGEKPALLMLSATKSMSMAAEASDAKESKEHRAIRSDRQRSGETPDSSPDHVPVIAACRLRVADRGGDFRAARERPSNRPFDNR